jgi:serine/threonine protein kinase
MELLRGEDLRARLRRKERLAVTEAVHIARQVLRGLSHAHAAHIVHRDLKPDNIFLCARDDDPAFVKIVDFGVSKMKRPEKPDVVTSQGKVLGTVFYMSPEQAQAVPDIDGRADIYSVGAILFEALAGRPPHRGGSYESILVSICTEDAPDIRTFAPDVPAPVAKAIARALSRDRDARYPSADAFALALDEALTDSLAAVIDPEVRRSRRARRLRTIAIAAVSALGALAVTALAVRANRASRESSVPNTTAALYRPVTTNPTLATDTAAAAPEPTPSITVASTTTTAANAPVASAAARTHAGTRSTKPTASQSLSPAPAASHQAVRGVADGLKLNLDEP